MSPSSAFDAQRQALTKALTHYDSVVTDGASSSALVTAEHQIYLASKALTTQLKPPGVFALDLVFPVVIACQLGIFDIVEDETTIEELAVKTVRIMRALASADIFTQPRRNAYAATKFSRKLRERPARTWTMASLFFMNKMCMNLPEALAQDAYRNPADPAKAAMTKAFGVPLWSMLENDENARLTFDTAMEQQDDLPLEMIPDQEVDWFAMLGDVPATEIAFVDVGGGNGHAMSKIAELTRGRIEGRFVLQDQQGTVESLQSTAQRLPFECTVHNFFEKQPIRGAKVYHIRRCLHDWSDNTCEQILRHLRDAMKPGYSRVLIHEFVLPVVGAQQREVLFDILMMCLTGSERDEEQWETLLQRSGLRIVKIWRAKIGHMAIIEAEAV
ncbi:hypothetical protein H2200_013622 [Cladophialophora chaetospira]|uniref:O-methyltransferase C-terminal domain-containing protein n=1 Tax=Cladophialophora chaetospira TaxID=386627 RepID=A0AA38UE14_9EURO|nr:hypothetical protein H2200_013622 [Cladophialophora chaetospira]